MLSKVPTHRLRKSWVLKLFQNDVQEIEQQCSISIENNSAYPRAVNLKKGKW